MKRLGRGSTIAGYLDEKLHFHILDDINLEDKEVIFIVGTNGKTTITNALNTVYKSNDLKVLSNLDGANLVTGIKNSIIMDLKDKTLNSDILLLEVDEKNVKLISKFIKPNHVILTNFFRDQLDRYYEVDLILKEIIDSLKPYNPTIYVNGQDPIINRDLQNTPFKQVKFSLDKTELGDATNKKEIKYCNKCKKKLKYNFFHYSHIGDFYCETCDFKVNNIKYEFSFKNNNLRLKENEDISLNFENNIPLYLIINYCLILDFGLNNDLINYKSLKLLQNFTMPKGRNNLIQINNKPLYLTLAKNVVGMEQTINYLLQNYNKIDLLIAFNDNYADSRDVSWIWDVNFEKLLPQINSLHIVGKRKGDMKLRFLYEGVESINTYTTIQKGIDEIIKCDNPVIISNYTPLKYINNYLKLINK